MSSRELTAGQTIAERYRLIALRGSGGMGSVWRAVHLPDERECALKILHRSAPDHGVHMTERFIREARAASSIDSPHAVRVLDFGMHGEIPFIAMELLEGETLAARLQSQGRLAPLETSRIIDHVASALDRAHELGIVHRDLKPENVFLADTERGAVAKVLDFGIAKLHDDEALARDLTETGALLGTPHYMSPEQVEGARYVDHRADLWSLGVIAFECITGQRPFKGDGLRALFGAICLTAAPLPSSLCNVPRGFDGWFAKATQKDPGRRFRSAGELASALRRVCEQELALTATEDEPASASRAGAVPNAAEFAVIDGIAGMREPRGTGGAALRWILASALIVAVAGWLSVRWFEGSVQVAASPAVTAAHTAVRDAARTPAVPAASHVADRAPLPIADGAAAPLPPSAAVNAVEASHEATETPRAPARARAAQTRVPAMRLPRTREAAPADRARGGEHPTRWDVDLMLRDRK